MLKKTIIFLLLAWLPCVALFAQDEEKQRSMRKNDWWMGASVGVTHSLAENATSDDFMKNYPGAELQLGTFVNRALGFRLSMGLNPQLGRPGKAQREGDPETYDTHYRFNVLTGFVDVMIDLTTLFTPRRKYRPSFDMMAFVGGGMLESFHFDYYKVKDWEFYPVDTNDKTCWATHMGLQATYRVKPSWDWVLEGSYTLTDGRYDGVESRVATSGFFKLHTGFVYHFHQRTWNRPGYRPNSKVMLVTDQDDPWEPSYTEKDRQRVAKERAKRLEKAQKENAKRRASKQKAVIKKNKEAKAALKQMRKDKEKRMKAQKEALLYNEI